MQLLQSIDKKWVLEKTYICEKEESMRHMWNWQKILIKWNSMDLHHNAYYQQNYSLVKDKTKCTHLKILSSNILLEQKTFAKVSFWHECLLTEIDKNCRVDKLMMLFSFPTRMCHSIQRYYPQKLTNKLRPIKTTGNYSVFMIIHNTVWLQCVYERSILLYE